MAADATKKPVPAGAPSPERMQAAMAALLKIPGVVRVGFGLKERAGQPREEWAYRVYVVRKRPPAEVPAGEEIPPEVDGISTDVLAGSLDDREEHSSTPNVAAGDSITREISNSTTSRGTVGLLVTRGGSRFLLTCHHVLSDDTFLLDQQTFDVYDPHKRTCAGIQCNHPVARIVPNTGQKGAFNIGGKTFQVDATLAQILDGVKVANVVPDLGPLDQGLRDLTTGVTTATPPTIIQVRKRGATSATTQGQVVQFFDPAGSWQLRVKPAPGTSYSAQFEVQGDDAEIASIVSQFQGQAVQVENQGRNAAGNTVLKLSGKVFSMPGDSGAPVVDDQRHVVGLVLAGVVAKATVRQADGSFQSMGLKTGDSYVEYIQPAFSKLGLDPTAAVIPPGSPSAGALVTMRPGDPAGPKGPPPVPDQRTLEWVEAALERTAPGRLLLRAASLHFPEIAHLVHHNRRVKVVWYRNMCHAFAAAFLGAAREPRQSPLAFPLSPVASDDLGPLAPHVPQAPREGAPGLEVPLEIRGVSRSEALRNLRGALAREGSQELRETLSTHGDWIAGLVATASSLPQLLETLATAETGETVELAELAPAGSEEG